MTQLLDRLRGAGLVLTLLDGDKLHVAPRAVLNEETRAAIRAERDALVQALKTEAMPARRSGNPLMTVEQGDACHWPVWSDAEIVAFTTRTLYFMRRGVNATDSDDLSERLTLRDREQDDRTLCLECTHYRPGRCGNHVRAGLGGHALPRDMATQLQHCPGFTPLLVR